MELKNNTLTLLKSPTRQSLSRACKSPMKSPYHEQFKKETKKEELASDLLQAFPDINENFDIIKKVGEGTFSKVFLAKMKDDSSKKFAFKHLIPTSSPGRIENELKCLQILGDKCNILGIRTAIRNDDHIVFVLPYFPHPKFIDTIDRFTSQDIGYYMKNLFIALKHVHSHQIIHRDVKPSNFLYCKDTDSYALIDFGLAMPVPGTKHSFLKDYTSTVVQSDTSNRQKPHSLPSVDTINKKSSCKHQKLELCIICKNKPRQKAPRAGTPGFRSPEVLMRFPKQTTAVDMWSAGVILLSLLSRRYPFFKAKDDLEALSQIVALLGSKKVKQMAETIGKDFSFTSPLENVDSLKIICERLARRNCSLHKPSSKRKQSEQTDCSPEKISRGEDNPQTRVLADITQEENKTLNSSEHGSTTDKKTLCNSSSSSKSRKKAVCCCIPDIAYDLLERLLELQPDKRLSAEDGLKHPFVTQYTSS